MQCDSRKYFGNRQLPCDLYLSNLTLEGTIINFIKFQELLKHYYFRVCTFCRFCFGCHVQAYWSNQTWGHALLASLIRQFIGICFVALILLLLLLLINYVDLRE